MEVTELLYDGVLNYDYNTIVTETECYVDSARRVVTLKAEEAIGLVDDDNVIIIYDITDNKPIIVTERCSLDDITEEIVTKRVNKFNAKNEDYIAAITKKDNYIDVTVTRKTVYDVIDKTM